MVLTDIICSSLPQIDIVSIDTGRLHEETYDLLAKLQRRYTTGSGSSIRTARTCRIW